MYECFATERVGKLDVYFKPLFFYVSIKVRFTCSDNSGIKCDYKRAVTIANLTVYEVGRFLNRMGSSSP